MGEFRMPSLGADMDAGTLVEWRARPGDVVKRGDVVALVETDKGIVEVEIWESGTIDALIVAPGTKVPVGTVLATTRVDGSPGPAPVTPPPAAAPAPVLRAQPGVRASPAAKQLARERGVDLTGLHGTGPHDSITRADVEHAATGTTEAAPAPAPMPAQAPAPVATREKPAGIDAAGMRRAIAAAMARSKREIPHYYLSTEIDASTVIAWLEADNATRPVTERILLAAVLLKATATAIGEVPEVNGFFVDGSFRPSSAAHLGVAISLRHGGLIAPAIHDVQARSVVEVQAALRDLVARTRAGRLRSSEMSDPTITVTNLGDQGVESVFGVIYPPQVALVGFGRVLERPWASGGMLGVRPVITATLSADHRVSDGHRGGVFLSALNRLLQTPEKL
jgi:pyruvate dehydrogenase E2 component (dihydrolipoamide acetyltransferase)